MSTIEILILVSAGLLFAWVLIELFPFLKKKDKKEKQSKKQEETKQEKKEEQKLVFKITKKGNAKISKNAISRDSRTGAIIEQAIKKEKKEEFKNFDQMLETIKEIGDPDELDDETFKKLFMPGFQGKKHNDDEKIDLATSYRVSRKKLDHFSVDGEHLKLEKSSLGLPNRSPVLRDIVLTNRITGRYDNIRTGEISMISPETKKEEKKPKIEEDFSDEDLFAKIMERRRREQGIDLGNQDSSKKIDAKSLFLADAIVSRKKLVKKD